MREYILSLSSDEAFGFGFLFCIGLQLCIAFVGLIGDKLIALVRNKFFKGEFL